MKSTLNTLLFASLVLASCSKKNDNPTPNNSSLAVISASVLTDKSLHVDVHYSNNNAATYYDDIIKLYINDTFANNATVNPQGPNTDFNYTFTTPKYLGNKYRIDLVRETTPGNNTIICSYSGN